MHCPNCSNPLQESKKYEVDIDYCPKCKGVWLDRGEIDKIANIQSRYEEEHYQKYHHDQRDNKMITLTEEEEAGSLATYSILISFLPSAYLESIFLLLILYTLLHQE